MSTTNQKSTNVSLERRVVSYLPPLYYRLFSGYVAHQELSESASCADIVKKFFDSLPDKERQKYLAQSKNSY